MKNEQALEIVNQLLSPKELSYLERAIFLASWSGQLYREVSQTTGYELGYVKDVGAHLWLALSEALGQSVTKKNLYAVLSEWNALEGQKGQNLLQKSLSHSTHFFADRAIPSGSALYIERPPIEEIAGATIDQPGSLLRIRAPQHMGKTSLLNRLLNRAREQNFATVTIDLQQADRDVFTHLNRFLRWLSWNVSHQLNLEPQLEQYWFEEIGSKVSCTNYFQEYLLKQTPHPIVLAFDEVNRLFKYTELAQDFLPMLRNWHDQMSDRWQNLRLVLSYSTEIYISLNFHQSPFNVGLPLVLPEFTRSQVQTLAYQHRLHEDLDALYQLVGGHPYLLQTAFYALHSQRISFDSLMQTAATASGIYNNHLRQLWLVLQQSPDLDEAFQQVITAEGGIQLAAIHMYLLEGMGLITLQGNCAFVRCELYRQYFLAQYKF